MQVQLKITSDAITGELVDQHGLFFIKVTCKSAVANLQLTFQQNYKSAPLAHYLA